MQVRLAWDVAQSVKTLNVEEGIALVLGVDLSDDLALDLVRVSTHLGWTHVLGRDRGAISVAWRCRHLLTLHFKVDPAFFLLGDVLDLKHHVALALL